MNHLEELSCLRNESYTMRHGRALSNNMRILVGNPINGLDGYGLIQEGVDGVYVSVNEASFLNEGLIIFSSDFLRARQTAEILAKLKKAKTLEFVPELRERYFGELELASGSNGEQLWQMDKENPLQKYKGVESINEIQDRITGFIKETDKKHSGEQIVYVTHGDPARVLLACANGISMNNLLSLNMLKNAEIQRIFLKR